MLPDMLLSLLSSGQLCMSAFFLPPNPTLYCLQDCSFLWLYYRMTALQCSHDHLVCARCPAHITKWKLSTHHPLFTAMLLFEAKVKRKQPTASVGGNLQSLLADWQSRPVRCIPKLSCLQSDHIPLCVLFCALWESMSSVSWCPHDLHGWGCCRTSGGAQYTRKLVWLWMHLLLTEM